MSQQPRIDAERQFIETCLELEMLAEPESIIPAFVVGDVDRIAMSMSLSITRPNDPTIEIEIPSDIRPAGTVS